MKILALIWVSLAFLVAVITTLLQVQPALTFITMLADTHGRYSVFAVMGATLIILLLPLLLIMFINNLIQNSKNKMPVSFTGKTGIVLKREKELTNAALMYAVYINGEQKSRVGMGKSVFIELPPGTYSLQIKLGRKIYSPEISVQLEPEKIVCYQTRTDINKSLTTFVAKGEMLFLVQIPFSK